MSWNGCPSTTSRNIQVIVLNWRIERIPGSRTHLTSLSRGALRESIFLAFWLSLFVHPFDVKAEQTSKEENSYSEHALQPGDIHKCPLLGRKMMLVRCCEPFAGNSRQKRPATAGTKFTKPRTSITRHARLGVRIGLKLCNLRWQIMLIWPI